MTLERNLIIAPDKELREIKPVNPFQVCISDEKSETNQSDSANNINRVKNVSNENQIDSDININRVENVLNENQIDSNINISRVENVLNENQIDSNININRVENVLDDFLFEGILNKIHADDATINDSNNSVVSSDENRDSDSNINRFDDVTEESNSSFETCDSVLPAVQPDHQLRERNTLKPPIRFDDYETGLIGIPDPEEPVNLKDALNSKYAEQWKQAINKELESSAENETWEIVDLPENCPVIDSKWVF